MSILAKFDGFDFPIRESDGYWNLTAMCARYNRRIDNFMRLQGTKDFLVSWQKRNSLRSEGAMKPLRGSRSLENEGAIKPFFSEAGGSGGGGATWGHPQLALKLAAWLNPDFEVWVYATIEKLFQDGQVTLENEIESLRQSLDSAHTQIDRMWDDSTLNDLEIRYGEYLEEIGD